VALLERWCKLAGMQQGAFLFQAFSARDTSPSPTLTGEQLGYPQARYHVLAQLAQQLGLDHKATSARFGLHSLRSGGATLCALQEVDERLFQEHGGWASKAAMHNYIQESLSHRMAPTAAMDY
jgi:integrase